MMIRNEQIRAGRSLLGMTQAELAVAAGLSVTGLNNVENGRVDPKASTLRAIQSALENAGVMFIPQDNNGPGVRLRDRIER
jgi:predicted transcriptional regulator